MCLPKAAHCIIHVNSVALFACWLIISLSGVRAQATAACSLAQPAGDGAHNLLPNVHNTQRMLAQQPNTWAHHFTFQAAVQLDNQTTAFHALRSTASSSRSRPRVLLLGDSAGRLYFFTPEGHLLYEHTSDVDASVTSIQSFPLTFNSTSLATGYADGTLVLSVISHSPLNHKEDAPQIVSVDDEVISTAADRVTQHIARQQARGKASKAAAPAAAAKKRRKGNSGAGAEPADGTEAKTCSQNSSSGSGCDTSEKGGCQIDDAAEGSSVDSSSSSKSSGQQQPEPDAGAGGAAQQEQQQQQQQDMVPADRSVVVRHMRYVRCGPEHCVLLLEAGGSGWLLSRRSGQVRLHLDTPLDPLALQASDHQALVINSSSISIAWLRSGRSLVSKACAGLQPSEHGPLLAVAFDLVRNYKAYILTASGQLLTMVVPFAKQAHICRVVSRIDLGLPPGPISLHPQQQRLLVVHREGVALLALPHLLATAGAVRRLVSARWQPLWQMYNLQAVASSSWAAQSGQPATAVGPQSGQHTAQDSQHAAVGGAGVDQGLTLPGAAADEVGVEQTGAGRQLQGGRVAGESADSAQEQQTTKGAAADAAAGLEEQSEQPRSASAGPRQWLLQAAPVDVFGGGGAGTLALLPVSPTAVAVFVEGGACGGGGVLGGGGNSRSSSSSSSGGSSSSDGEGIPWGRMLQPVLVVMMVVVAVWQFLRTTNNKNRYRGPGISSSYGAAGYGGGSALGDPSGLSHLGGFEQGDLTDRLRMREVVGGLPPGVDRALLERLDQQLGRTGGFGGGGGLRRPGAGQGAMRRVRPEQARYEDLPDY